LIKTKGLLAIPYGYCHCGCGEKTKICPITDRSKGRVKGEPYRYLQYHARRPNTRQIGLSETLPCIRCKQVFTVDNFYVTKGQYQSWCKGCFSEHTSHRNRTKKYGITIEQYQQLYQKYNGACYICQSTERTLCVDHDHTTGQVRGLLCNNCNRALGLLGDSILVLERAVNYMKEQRWQE
jgi:thiol-disulfide isomerase/thioredoxin